MTPPSNLRLDGRVAVVTGAGSGLGRAHALLLGSLGAAVVVNDLDAGSGSSARAVVDDLVAAGGTAMGCAADVSTEDGAASLVDSAVGTYGRLDAVVNNAGLLRACDFAEMTSDLFDRVVAVNLRSAFLVSRAAWPQMVRQGYGRIISTTSNSGLLGTAGSTAYAAAKAGVWGLTLSLALEGVAVGIQVNALAPLAYTPMAASSRLAPKAWSNGEGDAWSRRLDPALVAPVVAWLVHPQCTLNGQVLSSAGGRVARFAMALTNGYAADGLTIDDVCHREAEILSTDSFEILPAASEEGRRLHARLLGSHPTHAT